MIRFACVLQHSDEYDRDYVDHLREGIGLQLRRPFELTIIDGDGWWPGWWSKMLLFSPDVTGDLLYFDLDTVIVGSLDDIVKVDKLTVLRDFNVPDRMASGMMFIPERDRAEIWKAWLADPTAHMKKWHGHGDGGFLSQFWKDKAQRWQDILPGQVVSYKKDVKPFGRLPDGARVCCFHGRPRPRDVNWRVAA